MRLMQIYFYQKEREFKVTVSSENKNGLIRVALCRSLCFLSAWHGLTDKDDK